jgi:hypothetical protein
VKIIHLWEHPTCYHAVSPTDERRSLLKSTAHFCKSKSVYLYDTRCSTHLYTTLGTQSVRSFSNADQRSQQRLQAQAPPIRLGIKRSSSNPVSSIQYSASSDFSDYPSNAAASQSAHLVQSDRSSESPAPHFARDSCLGPPAVMSNSPGT